MLRRQCPVLLETRLDVHLHRVATAVTIEYFLTVEGNLDRSPELQRQLGHDNLVIEGITLAAETAAIGARDHAYA